MEVILFLTPQNKYSISYFINRFSQEPPHSMFLRYDMQKYLRLAAFKIVNVKPYFVIPRGVYQKINGSLIMKLWYVEKLLLKTKLSQIAGTIFWQTNLVKYRMEVEEL